MNSQHPKWKSQEEEAKIGKTDFSFQIHPSNLISSPSSPPQIEPYSGALT